MISAISSHFSRKLDARESEAQQVFGNEILDVNSEDPRPKALYFASKDPSIFFLEKLLGFDYGSKAHIDQLNRKYDVLYRVVENGKELCDVIEKSAKAGDIEQLIVFAHGWEEGFELRPEPNGAFVYQDFLGKIHGITKHCFASLAQNAVITLLACSTGKRPDGIAHAVARMSDREVYAPNRNVMAAAVSLTPFLPGNIFEGFTTCRFLPEGSQVCGIDLIIHKLFGY